MEIKISLSKVKKRLLKKVIFGLFPDARNIKFRNNNTIIKRRGLFSKKLTINIAELILISIPKELNTLAEQLDLGQLYPYFETLEESIYYFEEYEDIIEELFSTYSDIVLSNTLNTEYDRNLQVPLNIEVVESNKTKQLLLKTVDVYRRRIDEVIETSEHSLQVVHISSGSGVRGPPNILKSTTKLSA